MNKSKHGIIFLSLLTYLVFSRKSEAFEIIRATIGAEGAALGGAMSAVVNNPSALFWNPAGLANINGKEKQNKKALSTNPSNEKFSEDSFDKLFESDGNEDTADSESTPEEKSVTPFEFQLYTSYGYLTLDRHVFMAATAITLFKGTLGIGALGTYSPLIDGYDSSGTSTGSLAYGSYTGYAGYAWESGMMKIGLSLAGYNENLATQNYYGGGLNMGVQMAPIPILLIGAMVQNLPGFIQDSASTPGQMRKLDTIMKITIGITTPPPDASLMLLAGIEANLDQLATPEIYGNIGIRVKFAKYFSIMAGIRNNNFALGFGFNLPNIKIAYAINQDPLQSGFQHFVDINLAF